MSRPESVSSMRAMVGFSMAIWRISFRFFSPPLKPSLTGRSAKVGSMSRSFIRSRSSSWKSKRSSSSPSGRWACFAVRRKLAMETPGISTGYWKARKIPALERSSGSISRISSPLKITLPPVTSYSGMPGDDLGQGALSGAVGAHDGVDLPSGDVQVEPVKDLGALFRDLGAEVPDLKDGGVAHPFSRSLFLGRIGPRARRPTDLLSRMILSFIKLMTALPVKGAEGGSPFVALTFCCLSDCAARCRIRAYPRGFAGFCLSPGNLTGFGQMRESLRVVLWEAFGWFELVRYKLDSLFQPTAVFLDLVQYFLEPGILP